MRNIAEISLVLYLILVNAFISSNKNVFMVVVLVNDNS